MEKVLRSETMLSCVSLIVVCATEATFRPRVRLRTVPVLVFGMTSVSTLGAILSSLQTLTWLRMLCLLYPG